MSTGLTRPRRWIAEMSVGKLLGATIGLLLALAVVGIGLALLANGQLDRNRRLLLDQVGPSVRAALSLENALVNEETGVRGYLITVQPQFLEPYRQGLGDEARAYSSLRVREEALGAEVAGDVEMVRSRAHAWRREFVTTALAHPGGAVKRTLAADVEGKRLFDSIRRSLARLQASLTQKEDSTRSQLESAASRLQLLLVLAGLLILGGVLGAGLLLRRTITVPLAHLGAEARRVTSGEFSAPLVIAGGPREVVEVGGEIDAMRERIVAELATVQGAHAQLEAQSLELRRSNGELEQFAYVASHDLQEPLRKVASFCQALQSRYHGQLDERADQYIDFAVDGAKRMQVLINDLLAFSRVGRRGALRELVGLDEVLSAARSALAEVLKETGTRIEAGELPVVNGDRTLLTSLFQNLIANAVKFRGADSPVVRIAAQRTGDEWELSFADNGIGVETEYAERIFLIFQRLHSREAYDGSGIGLALCRKIVEYHGGRIWLDTDHKAGACFRLTLTVAKETMP